MDRHTLRVAVAVSHPIQHFCPLYRALTQDGRAKVTVLFESLRGAEPFWDPNFGRTVDWGSDVTDGFDWLALTRRHEGRLASAWRCIRSTVSQLRRMRPDVVVVYSYTQVISVAAAIAAKLMGYRVAAITDSELLAHRSGPVRILKRLVVRMWLRLVDVLLTCGDENERYFEHYGFPRTRMVRCPFPIDEESFQATDEERIVLRRAVRRQLGIPESAFVILNVAKLVAWKGQEDLIRAVAAVATGDPGIGPWLLLLGDGPDREALHSLATDTGVREIVFGGFVSPKQLPRYYAAADLYVHPSLVDPHPLAVTEAICTGLPVIATDRVGSAGRTDDLQAGRNGWVTRAGDWQSLAQLLRDRLSRPEELSDAAMWSLSIYAGRGMAATVDGFISGVRLAAAINDRPTHLVSTPCDYS